ncbi:MAG TPA: 3-alpha domain-containing protein [Rubrobacteraceae bacterium]|nr:3-alpha domain-containing protein [Rubrobacteraceae bacterium]
MRAAVVSLNVAFPSKQRYEGRELLTGGAKRAVERAMLRFENSVADVNDVIYERSKEVGLIERLSTLPEFAAGGRALFARRAANLRREK